MNPHTQNPDGYIVFEDGGTCALAYGATEKWFSTYDDAMKYAISIVNERIEEFKRYIDCNSVVVYEAPEEVLHQTHSVPGGRRVVFEWRNYHFDS